MSATLDETRLKAQKGILRLTMKYESALGANRNRIEHMKKLLSFFESYRNDQR